MQTYEYPCQACGQHFEAQAMRTDQNEGFGPCEPRSGAQRTIRASAFMCLVAGQRDTSPSGHRRRAG